MACSGITLPFTQVETLDPSNKTPRLGKLDTTAYWKPGSGKTWYNRLLETREWQNHSWRCIAVSGVDSIRLSALLSHFCTLTRKLMCVSRGTDLYTAGGILSNSNSWRCIEMHGIIPVAGINYGLIFASSNFHISLSLAPNLSTCLLIFCSCFIHTRCRKDLKSHSLPNCPLNGMVCLPTKYREVSGRFLSSSACGLQNAMIQWRCPIRLALYFRPVSALLLSSNSKFTGH
jgi:hypothetical protein